MKHILLGAVVTSLLLSTSLFAKDEKGRDGDKRRGTDHAERIDTDQDGRMSIEEYMAHSQQRFEAMDLNGDNFVTAEEGKKAAAAMRKKQDEARSALEKRKKGQKSEVASE